MRNLSCVIAIALVSALVACGKKQEETTQTITLSRGSTLAVSTTSDGKSEVVATVPPGAQGAGTYTSTAESLVDVAREAKNSLNEPGVTVQITVNDKGRLVGVRHTRTQ